MLLPYGGVMILLKIHSDIASSTFSDDSGLVKVLHQHQKPETVSSPCGSVSITITPVGEEGVQDSCRGHGIGDFEGL